MKLLTLKCAEICADISNNWIRMSTEDMIQQFESLRVCCTPPLDRFAAAEILSCHSVYNGKHAFHSAILRWMAMPDFDTEPPSSSVSRPVESLFCDTSHTEVADFEQGAVVDTQASCPDKKAHGAGRRRKQ
jgi:hypothetical protein